MILAVIMMKIDDHNGTLRDKFASNSAQTNASVNANGTEMTQQIPQKVMRVPLNEQPTDIPYCLNCPENFPKNRGAVPE